LWIGYSIRFTKVVRGHPSRAAAEKFTICNVWFGVPGFRPNG
jgi:hypothetical protein